MTNDDDYQDEHSELMKQKANYFFKNIDAIHLTYKNGSWLNGRILEIGADFLIVNDFIKGNVPVFFLEIKEIIAFTSPYKRNAEKRRKEA